MPDTVAIPIQIRFSDVDMGRHVHNAVYLQWFEQVRMHFFNLHIAPGHDWLKLGVLLGRNEVDYRIPVRLSDSILASVRCVAIGSKSITLGYRIVEASNHEKLFAEGQSVLVCFDQEKGHSIPVPDTWRAALAKHMPQ